MTLSKGLEQEHRTIDQGIDAFSVGVAQGDDRAAVLTDALDELRRHIYFEEELLFPPLQEAGLVPPLFVMRREHGEIWASMDALSGGLTSQDPAAATAMKESLERLMAQLATHNAKEEMVVYQAADTMIPTSAQEELEAQLGSVQMPDAWVCEAVRP